MILGNVSGGGLLVGAVALSISSLVVGNVAMIAAPTPAYAASKKSSKKDEDDPLKGIKVKKSVNKYSWSELAKISDAMTQAGSRKAAIKIAKKYKLCDKKGKLDGSQTKQVSLQNGEGTAMIVGFYHDDLSDGSGKAGITWQFADGLYSGNPLYASHVTDFDILPSSLKDCLATVTKKTVYLDGAKTSEATSEDVKLWAPSATECLGDASEMGSINRDSEWMANSLNAEGAQYDYYKDAGLSWTASTGHASNSEVACQYKMYFSTGESASYSDAVQQGQISLSEAPTPSKQNETGFRSLYYNPSKPDAELDCLAGFSGTAYSETRAYAASNNSSWPVQEGHECAVMPMFCLTSSAESDSGSPESNGVTIQDSVDNYSWKDLKAIADEIAAVPEDADPYEVAAKYHLGDEYGVPTSSSYKTVKLKNGATVKAYILDYDVDDRADGKGKAGITLMFEDTPLLEASMNKDGANSGGWKDSDLRKTLNKKVLNNLPSDLKKSIVKVNKLTNNTGVTTDVASVTTTEDALWLPSLNELDSYGRIKDDQTGLGKWQPDQVAVYEAEGSTYFGHQLGRMMDANNSNAPLAWTRTSDASSSGKFFTYHGYGLGSEEVVDAGVDASKAYAVLPGFCL